MGCEDVCDILKPKFNFTKPLVKAEAATHAFRGADLICKWHSLCTNGSDLFRNTLEGNIIERIEGTHGFIKVANFARIRSKRKTVMGNTPKNVPRGENVTIMRHDPKAFNFTKTRDTEILALYPLFNDITKSLEMHSILINASPLADTHVLLVPYVNDLLTQTLTAETLYVALSFGMAYPTWNDFKVFFNSAGAWASVNHLHFHGCFISSLFDGNCDWPIERCASDELLTSIGGENARIDVQISVIKYPVRAFRFKLIHSEEQVDATLALRRMHDCVWPFFEYLLDNDIPHQLLISKNSTEVTVVPRKPQVVSTPCGRDNEDPSMAEAGLHLAASEIFGMMTCMDAHTFQHLNENHIIDIMTNECDLSEDVHVRLRDFLKLIHK